MLPDPMHPGKAMRTLVPLFILLHLLSACQINTNQAPSSHASATPDGTLMPTQTTRLAPTLTPAFTQTLKPAIIPDKANTHETTPTTLPPGPTPSRRVILMAVGDIMLGRTIGDLIETEGHHAPFIYTAQTLRSADVAVSNLESPISDRGKQEPKTYAFRAPPAAAESLAFAGFNVVNLANNHSLDYGPLALSDTLETLSAKDILAVGAGMNAADAYAPVIIDVEGLRIAFLGFVDVPPSDYDYRAWEAGLDKPGVAWAHEEQVRAGVLAAKAQADIVVVLFHNGYELVQQVSSQQQKLAHLAIDSGASLVIGSHPHVLQRIEYYQEGLIAYSLGNFVFDNYLFPPNYSAILSVELSAQGVEAYELIDVVIQLNGVPQVMPYHFE